MPRPTKPIIPSRAANKYQLQHEPKLQK